MKRLALIIIALGILVIAFAKVGGFVQHEMTQSADRVVQYSTMSD